MSAKPAVSAIEIATDTFSPLYFPTGSDCLTIVWNTVNWKSGGNHKRPQICSRYLFLYNKFINISLLRGIPAKFKFVVFSAICKLIRHQWVWHWFRLKNAHCCVNILTTYYLLCYLSTIFIYVMFNTIYWFCTMRNSNFKENVILLKNALVWQWNVNKIINHCKEVDVSLVVSTRFLILVVKQQTLRIGCLFCLSIKLNALWLLTYQTNTICLYRPYTILPMYGVDWHSFWPLLY